MPIYIGDRANYLSVISKVQKLQNYCCCFFCVDNDRLVRKIKYFFFIALLPFTLSEDAAVHI